MSDPALVIGGAGFVGWHVVKALVATGRKVQVFDRAAPPEALPSVTYIQGDVTNPDALNRAMDGMDQVYHLAALSHLWASDTALFDRINHLGTLNVIAAAQQTRPHCLVYTSTEVILRGWNDPSPTPLTEADPLPALAAMAGPYTRSKWHAEQAMRRAALDGLPVRIVYPTMPIGAGDRGLTPPARMIRQMLTAPPPAYLPCMFNLVPVAAVADAHLLAAQKGADGGRYLLGGEDVSFKTLLEVLNRWARKPPPRRTIPYWLAETAAKAETALSDLTKRAPNAPLEGVRLVKYPTSVDNAQAKTALGWQPGNWEEALADAVADMGLT